MLHRLSAGRSRSVAKGRMGNSKGERNRRLRSPLACMNGRIRTLGYGYPRDAPAQKVWNSRRLAIRTPGVGELVGGRSRLVDRQLPVWSQVLVPGVAAS